MRCKFSEKMKKNQTIANLWTHLGLSLIGSVLITFGAVEAQIDAYNCFVPMFDTDAGLACNNRILKDCYEAPHATKEEYIVCLEGLNCVPAELLQCFKNSNSPLDPFP